MASKELKLDGGGLIDLRINEQEGYLAFIIERRKAFKGDKTSSSMLAMLDEKQERALLCYLEKRLFNHQRPMTAQKLGK